MSWKDKLTSRKWWSTVITAAAGFYMAVTGNKADDVVMQAVGIVAAAACVIAYNLAEGGVDKARIMADSTVTTKTVTATASDKATVQAMMGTAPEPPQTTSKGA